MSAHRAGELAVSGTVPLGDVAKSTSARFNLVGLAPSALLAAGIGLLIASGAFVGVPSAHLLVTRLQEVNVFIASVLFLLIFCVALILHPFQIQLVRILEGYWDEVPVLRSLKFIGVEINRRRRWDMARIRKDTARLADLYPARVQDLLPTRLGNVLRAAERRAGKRHGFRYPVEMLPRIYPYISAPLSDAIGDARDELDIACRMCVVMWALAVIAAVAFAADGAVPATSGAVLAIPAAAALLGAVSYRGAVRSAENYGKFLFYVFDLHRQDLIRALGYEPPRNPEAEIELIEAINRWLVKGSSPPAGYRQRSSQRSVASP
jgi:hypothetical protein